MLINEAPQKDSGALLYTLTDAMRIGKKLGVKWAKVNVNEFVMGLNEEKKHDEVTEGDELKIAKLALRNLQSLPDYYTQHRNMEINALEWWRTKTHPKLRGEERKTICVDFDDTIFHKGVSTGIGPIVEGAKEALAFLRANGYQIIVSSGRTNRRMVGEEGARQAYSTMKAALDGERVPYDVIDTGDGGKVWAVLSVDDRGVGIPLRGTVVDWERVLKEIFRKPV